jgi:hypothetical protein
MLPGPEVIGLIGLVIAAVASLAIWFRLPVKASQMRPAVCINCGTVQHNLSRTAALAHEFVGSDTCISCGEKLNQGR